MPSPTQRSLAKLRSDGYTAAIVEHWNPFARIRQDLYGYIDVLGICSGKPVLGIQATSTSNISARYKKSIAIAALKTWLETGSLFQVWGWSKKGPKGKKKTWQLTVRNVTLDDIKGAINDVPPDDGQGIGEDEV